MKAKSFIFLLVVVAVLLFALQQGYISLFNSREKSTSKDVFKIAILVPTVHPALAEIEQGFKDTLKGVVDCVYTQYNAQGDPNLLRRQAEEIVSKDFDLIFTLATNSALIVKQVTAQRKKPIPVVAGAADDPVGIKLIKSMQASGNNIVAITSTNNYERQVSLLQLFKPAVKSILLVYNLTVGLEQEKKLLQKVCEQKNIELKALEIFSLQDVIQKVPSVIRDYDVVMVFKDNLVVSGIESLVNLCNRMGKILYASDLNSGDKGAVLSFGIHEYDDGVESGKKAIQILKDGKKPSQIPSSAPDAFKLKLNTKMCKQQHLDVSDDLKFLMQNSEVI